MGNYDLVRIIKREAELLKPEVLHLLEKQIIKRNLYSDDIKEWLLKPKNILMPN
jgi:hypothetical protein